MRSFRHWTTVVALSALCLAAAPVMMDLPVVGTVAAEAATISRVSVSGATRVDTQTIVSYLKIKPGKPFAAGEIDESIKALFATGMFSDVKITTQGSTLVVNVTENPVIARIAFQGNDAQSDDILKGIVELQPRSVMTKAKVESDTQRLLEFYRRTGHYDATVEPKTVDLGQGRVDLIYAINEGDRTEVSTIKFVGNKAFSEWRLHDVVTTKESGLFGWLKTSDNYDPDKLKVDQEKLQEFYYNHGYADFRVISATADFDRAQKSFFITFTVDEGPQYRYGDVNVETTLSEVKVDDLKSALSVKKGDVYAARDVKRTLEDMTTMVASRGYAFVQVRPRGDRDYNNHTIAVTFFVDEGQRAYIERLNIIGNDRTRDYVIRREFDIGEGDAYNQVLIEKAERRLKNLGYFKTVKVWSEQGSAPDKVIVNVQVDDQATGEVSIGAGYSTQQGILAELSLTEKNFLGRGQYLRASISRGIGTDGNSGESSYALSFTEPYLFDRRLSGGFDVYQNNYSSGSDGVHPYDEKLTGGKLRLGIPLGEDLTLGVYYEGYKQKISGVEAKYQPLIGTDTDRFISSIGYTLTYNTIDDFAFPRNGLYGQFGQQFAGVGGDATYIKTTARGDYYKELIEDYGLIAHVGVKGGAIAGIGEDLQYIDQFRIGGEVIRGFDNEGLGPRDKTTGYALGGKYYAAATAETIFPIFGLPEEYGFYGSLFADGGAIWSTDTAKGSPVVEGNDLAFRASVGAGIIWQSPFGLLRADFAYPVMKEDYDKTQIFRFSGGTKF
jgi:outer membrane protein insertion porin family